MGPSSRTEGLPLSGSFWTPRPSGTGGAKHVALLLPGWVRANLTHCFAFQPRRGCGASFKRDQVANESDAAGTGITVRGGHSNTPSHSRDESRNEIEEWHNTRETCVPQASKVPELQNNALACGVCGAWLFKGEKPQCCLPARSRCHTCACRLQ